MGSNAAPRIVESGWWKLKNIQQLRAQFHFEDFPKFLWIIRDPLIHSRTFETAGCRCNLSVVTKLQQIFS